MTGSRVFGLVDSPFARDDTSIVRYTQTFAMLGSRVTPFDSAQGDVPISAISV